MTNQEFVQDLYDKAHHRTQLLDIQTATEGLRRIKFSGVEVPESITPKEYMDIWNEILLSRFWHVITPEGSVVPRWTQMTVPLMAKVIKEALHFADVPEVQDLVDYLEDNDIIRLTKTIGGDYTSNLEKELKYWCNELLHPDPPSGDERREGFGEWIRTIDKVPEKQEPVLVCVPPHTDKRGEEFVGYVGMAYYTYFPNGGMWCGTDGNIYGAIGIIPTPTHWMYLPKKPY